ncbi:hypothetical protein ACVWY3_000567 [Bradyrhizobium sp. USDA 4486]
MAIQKKLERCRQFAKDFSTGGALLASIVALFEKSA